MNFNQLDENTKKKLHEEILSNAMSIGSKNAFLQMMEDIKEAKPKPLLNKTAIFHYSSGKISWGKSIYKETLNILFSAMRKEEQDGDILEGLKPKDYKNFMNMMRALKPVELIVKPKNIEEGKGFNFSILDTSQEKKTKISLMFKIIFFYNIEFAKKALSYEAKEE